MNTNVSSTGRPKWAVVAAMFAGGFGVLTVFSGITILFTEGPAKELAGSYVPFVLWFNFLAGFAYIAAAFGLSRWRPWIVPLAFAIGISTFLVFGIFLIHVLSGAAYEVRTIIAMIARGSVWIGIGYVARSALVTRS